MSAREEAIAAHAEPHFDDKGHCLCLCPACYDHTGLADACLCPPCRCGTDHDHPKGDDDA